MYVLNANHISKSYKTAGETMRILQNVNLQVMKGEMVAIMGPSGSGKTTLLHVLTGVDTPDDGEIVIGGETFSQLTEEEKAFFRRKHMGMIFQDFQLLESLTVKENILLPLILERKEADIQQERFSRIADVLGIEKLADKGITEISGGQKQRVAIGRALINEPDIIFGDEPTGSLDRKTTGDVMRCMKQMNQRSGISFMLVTHDAYTASFCDRVLFLQDGNLAKEVKKENTADNFREDTMGMNRMYAFWCLLHRMQMMLGWTWRSMLNGEEQYLTGMLNHDGRPNENYREYQWIASDFRKLEKYGFPYLPQPEIAVSYSYDSELMAAYAKMQYRMPYSNNLAIAHRILEERNLDYNVVDLHQMTEQYQILIIPGEIVMDHEQENTVREFVKNGGTAIMTGYSAWVKETGQVFDTSRPGNLTDVFGIEIVGYQRTAGMEVSEKEEQKLRRNPANGRELLKVREKWIDVDYYEQIEATDAEVLQREETHQIPAITRNRYGKGAAYYLFCETEPELLGEVLDECCREKSMQSVVTPQGVIGRKIAENQYFYVNLTGKEQKIELPENGYGVLQEKKMEDTCTLQAFDGELVIC